MQDLERAIIGLDEALTLTRDKIPINVWHRIFYAWQTLIDMRASLAEPDDNDPGPF